MRKGSYIYHMKKARKEGYDKGYNEGVDDTVREYSAVIALCLKDKFGFTPEQIQEASGHINNTFASVCEGYLTLADIAATLEEEDDIQITCDGQAYCNEDKGTTQRMMQNKYIAEHTNHIYQSKEMAQQRTMSPNIIDIRANIELETTIERHLRKAGYLDE